MRDSPLKRLAKRGGLTWAALLVGLQRGWATQEDVAQAAVDWLSRNPDSDLQPVVLLAACERDDTEDVRSWLDAANQADAQESEQAALERWRWAFLSDLASDERIDDNARLQRLQELYAEFGYPPDMAACSPYYVEPGLAEGDTGKSPLEAMRDVAAQLEGRIFS